ncbi:ABC transporter ATP-binding protein/permease [Rodentibacter caecimuris]|uniref:ABC transporter ATP-binding protein/permease n=1 Tax=Rodentibacter caecimuris TaxID=1796644 RepID=UPI0010949A77|nr:MULTISPECIES: ABC transporter ATP-binding protein/permease [Pasteurellaceae]MCR1838044.1 ABC transporter ATP-binding protein/permease [Pasteurella caecimuris]MCU0107158.1 ABC transporter ATP-binding protein/permease [Pasteurella caecimuris]MCX2962224.1 ABC transporter ATP-binding protein/permease [Rodentibacter heylii]QIA77818.1 ABC transporter ATP-binding protein/permease [Rodentibacter heylii]TGY50630.1 ABC transporter ATP-binding protein/permease [Pasteurella caecimuris]
MDYGQEAITSLLWILRTLAITAVVFSLGIFLLVRFTHWGKQFWMFAGGYLSPKRSIKPLLFFLLIVALTLVSVRVSLVYSEWNNSMYTSLQEFNEPAFWQQMVLFCIIATSAVSTYLVSYYVEQRFVIDWITWLNDELASKWMANRAYYKTQYLSANLDNPDQRIQQDIQSYVKTTLSLSTGVIDAVTSMISYTILLWGLAGPMMFFGIEIPHMMVFLVFAYVIFTTLIAFRLGRPLIDLNFANERLNANYRYSLIRIKEYAESIAFYAGEKVEQNQLYHQFRSVIKNMWNIVFRTLKFSGFNIVVTQVSVVFPLLIQVGRYFEKQIKLGDLMQTLQVFGQLHSNLSFFRSTYDNFAGYKATLDRLTGFTYAIDMANRESKTDIQVSEKDVIFEHLSIKSPFGQTLIENLNLVLPLGASLLIQGDSGAGKTTLLRTAAGLWSYSLGKVYCPKAKLFLSQKPYLPQGSLLTALAYPKNVEEIDRTLAEQILHKVQLGHLLERIEQDQDWTRILSPGEQQRLAFARLLLHKPKVAFLDEATASMDEGLEYEMYRLLKDELPTTTIISVGHRSTLKAFHQQQLHLLSKGEWSLSQLNG